jgi:molybdopterin/thiamine biosynthesis adenylyltransferase
MRNEELEQRTMATIFSSITDEITDEQLSWQPLIFDRTQPEEAAQLDQLVASGKVWRVYDTIEQQLHDLVKTRSPEAKDKLTADDLSAARHHLTVGTPLTDFGRWIYYPWSGNLIHLLPPEAFRELRLDRNRHKITRAEQEQLARFTVGVVGLSVGNAVALTLALEGACGHLKLADFDQLDLSNMNRVQAGIEDIGLPKTVLTARQIFELNPYARLSLFQHGLNPDNLDEFLLADPKLDIVIDECDDFKLKVLLRERARSLALPVLMETSERGMVDVERFDLEPGRPLVHGLLGDLKSTEISPKLSDEEKFNLVLPLAGVEGFSAPIAASMIELGKTISTWPQLGSGVMLGGASMTVAVRRLALGHPLPSGRRYVDIQAILESEAADVSARAQQPLHPVSAQQGQADLDERIPDFIRFVVEHGTLAPSGGNCQPWRFNFDGAKLWLIHDRQRSKNLLDGAHHAAYLALGAAIENMTIAAAQRGCRTRIVPFPCPDDQTVVAGLSFDTAGHRSDPEQRLLFEQIRRRVTNRKVSTRLPLEDQQIGALKTAVTAYGCQLHLLSEEQALVEIGQILAAGDRIRFLCCELHRELMSELRWTAAEAQQSRDGIDLATLDLTPAQSAALKLIARPDVAALLRKLDGGQRLEESTLKAIRAWSAVGLITVAGQSPAAMLRAGQALERLWLQATALGLALHPMTAILYMFDLLYTEAASIFTKTERSRLAALQTRFDWLFPQARGQAQPMIFRLSRAAPPSERSLRYPIEQVLSFGAPQGENYNVDLEQRFRYSDRSIRGRT